MSRKRARRTAVRRPKRKNAVRRPGKAKLAMFVIDRVAPRASTPGNLAKRLDRDWFRLHPHRSHRLRHAIAGEFPGAPLERYVVVRQVQPGARLRQPFNMTAPLPHDEAPEHIAHAIYDLLQEYRGRIIPDRELFRRITAYAVGADPEDFSNDKPLRRH
jgi:hypothetical protein